MQLERLRFEGWQAHFLSSAIVIWSRKVNIIIMSTQYSRRPSAQKLAWKMGTCFEFPALIFDRAEFE